MKPFRKTWVPQCSLEAIAAEFYDRVVHPGPDLSTKTVKFNRKKGFQDNRA